jgi:hypothetical protein
MPTSKLLWGVFALPATMMTDWTFEAGLPGFPKHINNAEDANDVNFYDDLERQVFWHIRETTKITLIAI